MDLRLQPKPELEILPATGGIVSRKEFFVKKKLEEINDHFFAAHFIRQWKPKAELLYPQVPDETDIQYECDFNRDVQNCFVEDYAEEVFLRTPPPCFVVFGKFKRDVNRLCEKLTNEYGSVLIQVDDIVNQVLSKKTETSKLLDRILRLGVSLTLNFILALLSYLAHTPEARHRGYVLSGLPCLPLSYDLSVERQFHYLFTWENKPTFFINVLFDDEDLIKERSNLRVDLTGFGNEKTFTFHSFNECVPDDDDESDLNDEMLPIKEDPPPFEKDVNVSPSRPWVQFPRDEESRVWCEFEQYDNVIKPLIQLIKSRVDPQYFITIDSRVKNEFEVVQARLKLLQVWKAPIATPFFPVKKQDEFMGEDDQYAEEDEFLLEDVEKPPQEGFLSLFTQKTISPKFRWELSHYNYICPVSLREGELVEGKTKFAVNFMKYIYFLRDAGAMDKFIQNPRAYVLPIRPKPLCRFIILGYPYCGKTSLAKALSLEFSIPLIDLNTILKNDLERKRETYQEFCQQKAECREITRLTTKAWQDWRKEEERRIALIEEWILYIQSLMSRRIEQFYSSGSVYEMPPRKTQSSESSEIEGEREEKGEDSLKSRESGTQRDEKEDESIGGNSSEGPNKSEQDEKKQNANAFFSSMWNSFSRQKRNMARYREMTGEIEEDDLDKGEYDDYDEDEELETVDWCNLLPPQSLSSFLMGKKPFTAREKRQSFKIFLEAASKVYWAPSALKLEFAKWRLPCFMDIPLCELFLDNPLLLLRYLPEWLKERPLIPEPVDPDHPSVLEASRNAFIRAQVVSIKQTQEEVGILLNHAIEKAEREGMRVTGEVISPGGWVVDNMTLDLEVWNKLASEKVCADHIYILIDTEPEYRRILNTWWQRCGSEQFRDDLSEWNKESSYEDESIQGDRSGKNKKNSMTGGNKTQEVSTRTTGYSDDFNNVVTLLADAVKSIQEGNAELDNIYDSLVNDAAALPQYFLPLLVKAFISTTPRGKGESLREFKRVSLEDALSIQSISDTILCTAMYLSSPKGYPASWNMPLGSALETVTSAILDFSKRKRTRGPEKNKRAEFLDCGLEFLNFLLTLPRKLGQLKDWISNLNPAPSINEIEITGRTTEDVISDIRKDITKPFIKKPRELENFEMEEIKRFSYEETDSREEEAFENEAVLGEEDTETDTRIFGESGQLCIVNLERDIFLLGKVEHSLRYYGKLYYFWNEDAKKKFIEDPEKYAPYYSAIRCYPPLRIFITGPTGSGKTTVSRNLSIQCGCPRVEYPDLLFKTLIPHVKFEKMTALSNQKLLLSDNHNQAARQAMDSFLNSSLEKRQFWIEHAMYSDFIDRRILWERIMDVQQPVVTKNFPELEYQCIESAFQEELQGEGYLEFEKSEPPIPPSHYGSMEEIEAVIVNYLTNDTDGELNDYCIEKSFKTLWTKEPYITQGFILEGFPIRTYDIKAIIDNNWIPDLVIELAVPESEVIDRNIDNLMELWSTKLKRETVEEKLLEDTLSNIHRTWVSIKRCTLLREKREEIMAQSESEQAEDYDNYFPTSYKSSSAAIQSRSKIKQNEYSTTRFRMDSDSEFVKGWDPEIEAEIEEILNKEIPPLEFSPNFETYDAGKARIIENLIKTYRKESEVIEKIKVSLKEAGVPWLEVDGLKSINEILAEVFIKTDKIRRRLTYKGEFAFTLTMETAEELLKQGYYFLSKFGRWCPVQVYRMKNPVHMFRPFSMRGRVTPIAYRNYIYFVAGENEKMQFLQDPIKYTFNEPHHPNVPLRVAIIGPPKSGKTTLSTRLGMMFGLKVITMGSALRFALEEAEQSTIAKSIRDYLRRGCFLPLSLKMEALMICLNDPSCSTQGFVLDGIPFDAALTQSLAEKGKLPFVIISLIENSDFGKTNRAGLDVKQFRLPYKNRINLDTRYQDWNETYKRFAQWNKSTYNNLYELNAKLNVVDVFYQAYDIIKKSFFAILYYVQNCISKTVLPLEYLCISQQEYELRKSSFHNNCPVCWAEKKILVSSSDPPKRSGLVQYGKHFYWICREHMEKFTKHPKIYFLPHVPKWPEMLPKRLEKNDIQGNPEMRIHGYGRCPVTRTDFPGSLDWEGSWDFAVYYNNEVFLCKNENMLKRFLARPWNYCQADTKFEVERRTKSTALQNLGPPKMTSLPPIGFLEQTVATLIHEGLQVLGRVRPIHPNMSPSVTGCVFIALYLKVHNKKNKTVYLERSYLNFMTRTCRAFLFSVSQIRPVEKQIGQGDYEDEVSEKSDDSADSEEENCTSSAPTATHTFADFGNTEKKMWSAKKIPDDKFEMKMTSDNELMEIPIHPKAVVILKYNGTALRPKPIPPILNCITFIYSVKPYMTLPEKFNHNTMYQQLGAYSTSYTPKIMFNPNKKFAMSLYAGKKSTFPSKLNLHKGDRALSDISLKEFTHREEEEGAEYLQENFIPRFCLLDKIHKVDVPAPPKIVPDKALVYNPQRDYAYMMLLSEFFHTTHILKCFKWNKLTLLEFSHRLDNMLGPTDVQVDYIFEPRLTASERSRTSLDSYIQLFDAANLFAVGTPESESSVENLSRRESVHSSTYDFIHGMLCEKMEQLFDSSFCTNISFDGLEYAATSKMSSEAVLIHEMLPYPPLPWDISSRPYNAYLSISPLFKIPPLEHIAHERHFSLLDGIMEENLSFRYFQIPGKLKDPQERKTQVPEIHKPMHYFIYDFFNLPWTSFLTYQHHGVYHRDIPGEESPSED